MTHSPQPGDVQSSRCPFVSSWSRSQLKVKYITNKYYTLCRVRSTTPLLMEGFPSNLNVTFTSMGGCAEPMLLMCQLKVMVTVKCKILNKQLLDIMSCFLYKFYTNDYSYSGRISFKLKSFPQLSNFYNTSYPCFRFIMHNGGGMNRLQR